MQLACRPSRWLAGTRPGIGETFGSPPRCWGVVVSEVVRMRVSSCDPATRPIRPRPSYRTLNQHHLKRNRKFVDSPLEEATPMPHDNDDYEVVYARPPRHSRFVKGQSGNPKSLSLGSSSGEMLWGRRRGDGTINRCKEATDGVPYAPAERLEQVPRRPGPK